MIEGYEFRCPSCHRGYLRETAAPTQCPGCEDYLELFAVVQTADKPIFGNFQMYFFRRVVSGKRLDRSRKMKYNTDDV